jgi:hypothetical protein
VGVGRAPEHEGAASPLARAPWSRFIALWALATGLAAAALFGAFGSLFATTGDLPEDNAELEMALEHPNVFTLAITLDILVWIGLAGLLVALGAVLFGRVPIRGLLVVVAGAASSVGLAAAYLRLRGTLDLAERYEQESGGAREDVLLAHLDLQQIIFAGFNGGSLVGSLAFLLVGSAAVLVGLPRWIAVSFAFVGTLGLLNNILSVDALFLVYFALLIVLLFAVSAVFRRRASGL